MIVDDGSTDKTAEVVSNFENNLSLTINLISQKNEGEGSARNTGLKNINSKYVLFLDADDTISIDALEKMTEAIENYNTDLVFSSYKKVYSDKKFDINSFPLKFYTYKNLQRDFFKRQITIGIGNTLFKKEIIDKSNIKFGYYKAGADNHFFRDLSQFVNSGVSIPNILFNYNVNPSSVMHSLYSDSRIDSIISVIDTKLTVGKKMDWLAKKNLDIFLVNEIKGNAVAFLLSKTNSFSSDAWDYVLSKILVHMPKKVSLFRFLGRRRFIWLLLLMFFYLFPRLILYSHVILKKIRGKR